MNEFDRGIIKWQPFNSVINGEKIKREIKKRKAYQTMPELNEDQINLINSQIIEANGNGKIVNISYYYKGNILNKTGSITDINDYKKEITIDYYQVISLYQIIKIN